MIALRSVQRAARVRLFIKFVIVSGLNTAVGYMLFAAMILSGASSVVAVAASTVLGTMFNFASTGRIVFGSKAGALLPRFLAVYTAQGLLNVALLQALERGGIPSLAAQALLIPALALFVFAALRHFVFKEQRA
jgi:putative flippase GtrA